MCRLCRKEQMAIHAWLNPYRVTLNGVPEDLSDDNPALNGSAVTLQTDSTLILDPSEEKNRKLIADGVKEILERYPVDGIQFDDYFYPEDISDEDEAQYERYSEQNGNNSMSLIRWRTANVNMLMAKKYYSYSLRYFIRDSFIPCLIVATSVSLVLYGMCNVFETSIWRAVVIGIVGSAMSFIFGYFLMLNKEEKEKTLSFVRNILKK